MQIVFLIWPVLLLPVLLAWLTRPGQSSNRLTTPSLPATTTTATTMTAPAQKVASHSPAHRKEVQRASLEMLELAVAQRRRESPAYRLAAQTAYQEMQQMFDEQEERSLPPSSIQYMPPATRKLGTQNRFRNTHRHPLARLG